MKINELNYLLVRFVFDLTVKWRFIKKSCSAHSFIPLATSNLWNWKLFENALFPFHFIVSLLFHWVNTFNHTTFSFSLLPSTTEKEFELVCPNGTARCTLAVSNSLCLHSNNSLDCFHDCQSPAESACIASNYPLWLRGI